MPLELPPNTRRTSPLSPFSLFILFVYFVCLCLFVYVCLFILRDLFNFPSTYTTFETEAGVEVHSSPELIIGGSAFFSDETYEADMEISYSGV